MVQLYFKPTLGTIIDGKEKQVRDTERKRKKRGSVTRAEYKEQQQERTEYKLGQLEQAMQKYPNAKRKELAELLGVTGPKITQLKRGWDITKIVTSKAE